MRILVVTHYQPPHRGGIETVAAALVERYRAQRHEVVWLSSDLPPTAAAAGFVRLPAWNILEDRLGVPYPLWSPLAASTVRQWVDWCDVVHCHDCLYLGTVLAVRRARRLRKPVLLTQHVGPVPYRSAVLRAIQRLAYATIGQAVHRQADQVVFISRTVREWFEHRTRYARRSLFIANGVDTSLFSFAAEPERHATRARLGLPASRRVVLFVGRFVDKKGITVVDGLARQCPSVQFVVIGEGPNDPQNWGLANVIVLPFQPQTVLREYYVACDVLLLPSTGEGFPLVVMEAMACGTPAIVSGETFAAWNEGREFFLVAEPTVAAVASLLETTAMAPAADLRGKIAEYAKRSWDWNRVADQYLEVLGALVDQSAAPLVRRSALA